MVVEKLRAALRAAISEARQDPELLGRIVTTICNEFGLDPIVSMYITSKLKSVIKEAPHA
jgi:hypothetical protein